jgi:hypothetical protein
MKLLLLSFLAPVAAAAAAPAPATAQERAPRPALWLLADADTRIYLFGTTHILPAKLKWRSPALDRAIASADELVMETGDSKAETGEFDEEYFRPMMLDAPSPVLARVSAARRPVLARLIREAELEQELLDNMQDWAVAVVLTVAGIEREYKREGGGVSGAEEVLEELFRKAGKPISGVETDAEQMGFLASVSPATQRAMLEDTIDELASGDLDGIEGDDEAWASGDVEAIAQGLKESLPPEVYEVLLTRRNARWSDWLERRLERPGTVLFAVGAGHLAGADSVQAMLSARGLRVERID